MAVGDVDDPFEEQRAKVADSTQRSSGQSGAPSMKTTVAPHAMPPTTVHGPMIQPMSVENSTRSPGRTS
ncbi:MAG: hypothetical protein QXG03_05650, partial [Halalkalicoccus sp.]